LEALAAQMPHELSSDPGRWQKRLAQMPVFDLSNVQAQAALERLFMLYSYFANAWVYGDPAQVQSHLPPSIARPFVALSQRLERLPVLSYAALVLYNWRRLDPQQPINLENLAPLVSFQALRDEHWFGLVHVLVEANAAPAMQALPQAISAAQRRDFPSLIAAFGAMTDGIKAMLSAFRRMTEGCDPDVYHRQVRPFIFGLTNILYEGVTAYADQPQTFPGGSGAQSSTIPALVAALGIQHEQTGLMQHLDRMQQHMPRQHRAFIQSVTTSAVRDAVLAHRRENALKEAYNTCVEQLLIFRKTHLHYAKVYIFDKVANPVGTGGTPFMDWLAQLQAETESHLIA
jgi:indoleamine 2,3-dioxygenase